MNTNTESNLIIHKRIIRVFRKDYYLNFSRLYFLSPATRPIPRAPDSDAMRPKQSRFSHNWNYITGIMIEKYDEFRILNLSIINSPVLFRSYVCISLLPRFFFLLIPFSLSVFSVIVNPFFLSCSAYYQRSILPLCVLS